MATADEPRQPLEFWPADMIAACDIAAEFTKSLAAAYPGGADATDPARAEFALIARNELFAQAEQSPALLAALAKAALDTMAHIAVHAVGVDQAPLLLEQSFAITRRVFERLLD